MKSLALAVVAVLVIGAPARAQTQYKEWTSYCTSGIGATCLTLQLLVDQGANTTIRVQNLSGLWAGNQYSMIFAIRLMNLPDLGVGGYYGYQIASSSGPLSDPGATPYWFWPTGGTNSLYFAENYYDHSGWTTAAGHGFRGSIASACGQDVLSTIPIQPEYDPADSAFFMTPTCAGGSVIPSRESNDWVQFNLTPLSYGPTAGWDPSAAEISITTGTYDPSTGWVIGGTCTTGPGGNCVQVTPEPITLLLFGSGLLGLGGVAAFQRRRRSGVETE